MEPAAVRADGPAAEAAPAAAPLNAEAARGFHDIGEVWIEIGHRLSRQDLVREGRDLLTHAEQWLRDLPVSIARSIVHESVPPLLPSSAGS